jgi:hypothetical protein
MGGGPTDKHIRRPRFDEPVDVTLNITPGTAWHRQVDTDVKKALQDGVRPAGNRLAEVMPSS